MLSCSSFNVRTRITSLWVFGSRKMKSPKPKSFITALPRSTGSALEFLSRKVQCSWLACSRFSLSLDSMMMGR